MGNEMISRLYEGSKEHLMGQKFKADKVLMVGVIMNMSPDEFEQLVTELSNVLIPE